MLSLDVELVSMNPLLSKSICTWIVVARGLATGMIHGCYT